MHLHRPTSMHTYIHTHKYIHTYILYLTVRLQRGLKGSSAMRLTSKATLELRRAWIALHRTGGDEDDEDADCYSHNMRRQALFPSRT